MKILITAQYKENYAAHDWDGVGECPQYWKCKPSDSYEIQNLTKEDAEQLVNEKYQELCDLLDYNNGYSASNIIGMSIHEDDELIVEPWESTIILTYQDDIWTYKKTIKNDEYGYLNKQIAEVVTTGRLKPNGETAEDKTTYLLTDGNIINPSEFKKETSVEYTEIKPA